MHNRTVLQASAPSRDTFFPASLFFRLHCILFSSGTYSNLGKALHCLYTVVQYSTQTACPCSTASLYSSPVPQQIHVSSLSCQRHASIHPQMYCTAQHSTASIEPLASFAKQVHLWQEHACGHLRDDSVGSACRWDGRLPSKYGSPTPTPFAHVVSHVENLFSVGPPTPPFWSLS